MDHDKTIPRVDLNQFRLPPGAVHLGQVSPRGRRTTKPDGISGILTRVDIERLEASTAPAESSLVRIKESHHTAARLLAQGHSGVTVGFITGYAPATISKLKSDPAFQELLAFYKQKVHTSYNDVNAKLASLRDDAVGELQQRLANNPAVFKNPELIKLSGVMLDRTGFGPVSTVRETKTTIEVKKLTVLKAEVKARQKGEVQIAANAPNKTVEVGTEGIRTSIEDNEVEEAPKGKVCQRPGLRTASISVSNKEQPQPDSESVVQFPRLLRPRLLPNRCVHSKTRSEADPPDRVQTDPNIPSVPTDE